MQRTIPAAFQVGNFLFLDGYVLNKSAPITLDYTAGGDQSILKVQLDFANETLKLGGVTEMKTIAPLGEFFPNKSEFPLRLRVLFGQMGFHIFNGHRLVKYAPYRELWTNWLGDAENQKITVSEYPIE